MAGAPIAVKQDRACFLEPTVNRLNARSQERQIRRYIRPPIRVSPVAGVHRPPGVERWIEVGKVRQAAPEHVQHNQAIALNDLVHLHHVDCRNAMISPESALMASRTSFRSIFETCPSLITAMA